MSMTNNKTNQVIKKALYIAAGLTAAVVLAGCQPSGKDISTITQKDVAKIQADFINPTDQMSGVYGYEKCVSNQLAYDKNPDDEMAKMMFSGKYKAACETMFSNIQQSLSKAGFSVTLDQVKSKALSNKLIALSNQG